MCVCVGVGVCVFLMIGFKFLKRMGSIRKSIKNLYKKKFNKNVFFFLKLITQTKQSIFSRKIMIMQNINSYNL